MNAYYIVLHPASDAEEGTPAINPLYALVKNRRWVAYRRFATWWRKKENAERLAVEIVAKHPQLIGRVEVIFRPVDTKPLIASEREYKQRMEVELARRSGNV